jgi:murein DD-endopeptidase MepM/ murein hydrolase activator NlpD
MPRKPQLRVADRLSHPHPDRFLTFMVVLTRRTFRLTVRRKFAFWAMGITAGICVVAVVGSWYGFWATKKIISYSELEQETREQQRQLRESMEQANVLKLEVGDLHLLMNELIKEVNPRATSEPSAALGAESGQSPEAAEKVSAFRSELVSVEERLKTIQARTEPVFHAWFHTPSVWPTTGTQTSRFGQRVHPFAHGTGGPEADLSHHAGLDISNAKGTPIQATANGVVTFTGNQGHYGNMVVIRHSPEFETLYAHLHRIHVSEGQKVERGNIIGTMGESGRATGPHLHYEVRKNGHAVNPSPYLKLQTQWLKGLV